MAGFVCTVAGGKGGVGKTTTAINIGVALEELGYSTVVVDADLGMANLSDMLDVEFDDSIHDVLAGNATVSAALSEAPGALTIIPGEQSLEAFAEADPAKLRKVIKTLERTFDVVLVDTGAGLSHETTVPLGLADGILLVTTPDDVAVNDTVKTGELAERVDGRVIGTLVTRVTADTEMSSIEKTLETPLLGVIPVDIEATEDEPLVRNSPDSPPSQAYRQVTNELERVFFTGASGDELDRIFQAEWFEGRAEDDAQGEPAGEDDAQGEPAEEDDVQGDKAEEDDTEDEEDSDGVFGGLFG